MNEQEEFEFRKRLEDEKSRSNASLFTGEDQGAFAAGLRGAANMATAGLRDQLVAGVQHPVGAVKQAGNLIGIAPQAGDPDVMAYINERNKQQAESAQMKSQHPYASFAGGVAGGFLPGGAISKIGTAGGRVLAQGGVGALMGLGSTNSTNPIENAERAVVGGGLGVAGQVGGEYLGSKLSQLGSGELAENLAEKATGATGREVERTFQPGTGRFLLDEEHVKFGSSPADIAESANAGLEKAGNAIDTGLEELPEGTAIPKEHLIAQLKQKLASMQGDPSQAAVARKLTRIIEDFEDPNVAEALSPVEVEGFKRGFQKQSNYLKPNTTLASKATAGSLQGSVEDVAQNLDPAAAGLFQGGKEEYGMLLPVKEAAERRASQLSQSPVGGLLDVSAGTAGAVASGHPSMAVPTAIARRVISPRLASAGAVAADKVSDIVQKLQSVPGASKFIGAIKDAATRGPGAIAATHFILQQTEPDYSAAVSQGQ